MLANDLKFNKFPCERPTNTHKSKHFVISLAPSYPIYLIDKLSLVKAKSDGKS